MGAIVVAWALPSVARAADHTIDFSGDAPGTQLSTQYQSQDVIFGINVDGAVDQPQPLVVGANPNPPPSQVAEMTCGNEICRMNQWIEFSPAPVGPRECAGGDDRGPVGHDLADRLRRFGKSDRRGERERDGSEHGTDKPVGHRPKRRD
jgi:hypothetical protein